MKLVPVAVPLLAVLLAGCSSSPAEEPSPTATSPANQAACEAFSQVTKELAERIVEGSNSSNADEFKETMASMPGRFDEAALLGQGDVKERIGTLIEDLPDPVHMLFLESNDYFADIESVDRACKAEGIEVDMYTWS